MMPPTEPRAALRVAGLCKRYRSGAATLEVLRDVSFELGATGSLAVTGPSGSGKSTLLHILGTLEAPSAGRVEIAGVDPFELGEGALARFRNARIGFVFQEHHLLPQYDVVENLLLPTLAFPRALRPDAAHARALELIEKVGLGARTRHRPPELSGGERQRVAVARALIMRPELLLCDEPTGSLDARTGAAVAELLFELQAQEPRSLVIVTHSERLAARCGQRLELRDGRLG